MHDGPSTRTSTESRTFIPISSILLQLQVVSIPMSIHPLTTMPLLLVSPFFTTGSPTPLRDARCTIGTEGAGRRVLFRNEARVHWPSSRRWQSRRAPGALTVTRAHPPTRHLRLAPWPRQDPAAGRCRLEHYKEPVAGHLRGFDPRQSVSDPLTLVD